MKRSEKQAKRLRERDGRKPSKYAEKGAPYRYGQSVTRDVPHESDRGQHHRGTQRGSGAKPFMQGRGHVR